MLLQYDIPNSFFVYFLDTVPTIFHFFKKLRKESLVQI